MTWAKGHQRRVAKKPLRPMKGKLNLRMNNMTVKSFVICNSGHLLLGVHIKEYEIFVVRANIKGREMDAGLLLRSEVNGHIDDLSIA